MVILGVAASVQHTAPGRLGVTVTRIGGRPSYCHRPISASEATCRRCGARQTLILQAYAPIDGDHHRVVHLLACTKTVCSRDARGWRALRSQVRIRSEVQAHKDAPPSAPKSAEWEVDDDWGDADEGLSVAPNNSSNFSDNAEVDALLETHMAAMSISRPADVPKDTREPTPAAEFTESSAEIEDAVGYLNPCYKLNSVEENYEELAPTAHERALLQQYEREHGAVVADTADDGEWEGEGYEKVSLSGGVDDALIKFTARVGAHPRQCLRYASEAADKPLKFVATPSLTPRVPPPCNHCGGPRIFEMQLMPASIYLLFPQQGDDESTSGPEFGTVLVYSCDASCPADGFVEEAVYVHPDEGQK